MKLLAALLSLIAACSIHSVLAEESPDRIQYCNKWYAGPKDGTDDADSVYYQFAHPNTQDEEEFSMACNTGLVWYQPGCRCQYAPGYLQSLRRRPVCDRFMTNTYIQNNVELNPHGNKGIAVNRANLNDIRKTGSQMCFENGASVGIYYTVDNDFGKSFTINMVVSISGLDIQTVDTNQIVIISNGGCTVGDLVQPPTLTVSYTQSSDTYSVTLGGATTSCIPTVYNGVNSRTGRVLSGSRSDRLEIDVDNNSELTLSVNGNSLSASTTIGICSSTSGDLVDRNADTGLIDGTRCRLTFGDIGSTTYSICFSELVMSRECSDLELTEDT